MLENIYDIKYYKTNIKKKVIKNGAIADNYEVRPIWKKSIINFTATALI